MTRDVNRNVTRDLTQPLNAPGAVQLEVAHETAYRYAADVALAHHLAYLRPAETPRQSVEAFDIAISPQPASRSTSVDVFGNTRLFFSLDTPHARLSVRSRSRVRVAPSTIRFDPASSWPWEAVRGRLVYAAGAPYASESEFAFASPFVAIHRELAAYAAASFIPGRAIAEAAIDLMSRIHREFRYESDSTKVSTPILEAFAARRGVCQDFAHIMIGCLRALGLAARYVSGYLLTVPAPGTVRLLGVDASHAWLSVHCPDSSTGIWLDLDPTNDMIPSTSHVTLAIGRDFGDVSPLHGILRGGGEHTLSVGVTVRRVGGSSTTSVRPD